MSQTYYAILTAIGEAKLANAAALGTTLQLTQMAVGDGGGATPQPSRTQTSLVGEKRRGPLNRLSIDPANASQIIAEHIIPEDVGGWWIRELGLYDAAGDLCAVANCPDTYKPVLASGSGRIQTIRMVLIVSSTSAVQLKIDPSIVLAPRGYVDQVMAVHLAAQDPHPQYMTALEVSSEIASKADKATTLGGYGITDGLRQFKAGETLPTKDIGPIWHADYNSIMTWQVFNANDANYTGYASLLVGSLLADTQPTPRAGYISSGSLSLGRTAYAALRGWAMHSGIMVASGVWAAGAIAVADNADGTTFRAYDVRGEFPRFWDSGRGVDTGRAFGSKQSDAIRNITGVSPKIAGASEGGFDGHGDGAFGLRSILNGKSYPTSVSAAQPAGIADFDASRVVPTANENRPRNVALLPVIKF